MSNKPETKPSENHVDTAFGAAATSTRTGFNVTDCLGMMGYPYNTKDTGGFKLG
jgi:hypothetical protein